MFKTIVIIVLVVLNGALFFSNQKVEKLADEVILYNENRFRHLLLTHPSLRPFYLADSLEVEKLIRVYRVIGSGGNLSQHLIKVKDLEIIQALRLFKEEKDTPLLLDSIPPWRHEMAILEVLVEVFCYQSGCSWSFPSLTVRLQQKEEDYLFEFKFYDDVCWNGLLQIDGELVYRDLGQSGFKLDEVSVVDDEVIFFNALGKKFHIPIEKEKWCYAHQVE